MWSGNRQALAALEQRLAAEPQARAVFNGDAHWFDRDPAIFQEIEQGLSAHLALRGNVETELGRAHDSGAGCGCAYPASVDEAMVERSNAIQAELNRTVQRLPGMAARLAARPATALVSVGGQRVAISHGDEQSLAGCGTAPAKHWPSLRVSSNWISGWRATGCGCWPPVTPARPWR